MDTPAEDDDDIEAKNSAGQTVKMSVKNGKVAKAEIDEEDPDEEDKDDDTDPDNKVVLNQLSIKVTNKTDRKTVINSIVGKLKEVTNVSVAKDVLITELKEQLRVSNEAVKLTEDEVKAKIKGKFIPNNSSRSHTLDITDDGDREFMQPTSELGKQAAKRAVENQKK